MSTFKKVLDYTDLYDRPAIVKVGRGQGNDSIFHATAKMFRSLQKGILIWGEDFKQKGDEATVTYKGRKIHVTRTTITVHPPKKKSTRKDDWAEWLRTIRNST